MTDQNKMPDVVYVFNNPESIGDRAFTTTEPEDNHIPYTRTDIHQSVVAEQAEEIIMYLRRIWEELETIRNQVQERLTVKGE